MTRLARIMIAILLACLPLQARAADILYPELEDTVPGAAGANWLDLVRQVLPDYTGRSGTAIIPLRHIGGADMETDPPAGFATASLTAVEATEDGKRRHLLLIDLSGSTESAEGYAALALFDDAATPQLLDAALVSFDRLVFFKQPPTVRLAPGDDLVVVGSAHFNSSQGYGTQAMILPRGDRLELVDAIWTLDVTDCGYTWTQTPAFSAGEAAGRRYADVVATVTEVVSHNDEQCGERARPEERRRDITVTWRWDEAASRFLPDSDAFERLAAENEQRF